MTIGIPFAPGHVTDAGIVKTCPVCHEEVLEPWSEFDEDGEYATKDADVPVPTPYQLHYAVNHAGQR